MKARDEIDAYREAMGREAADRQVSLAQRYQPCCGHPVPHYFAACRVELKRAS